MTHSTEFIILFMTNIFAVRIFLITCMTNIFVVRSERVKQAIGINLKISFLADYMFVLNIAQVNVETKSSILWCLTVKVL